MSGTQIPPLCSPGFPAESRSLSFVRLSRKKQRKGLRPSVQPMYQLTAAADATLGKEGRMHFTGFTILDRKSGEAEGSQFASDLARQMDQQRGSHKKEKHHGNDSVHGEEGGVQAAQVCGRDNRVLV